jgi:hypothetical protein
LAVEASCSSEKGCLAHVRIEHHEDEQLGCGTEAFL